MRYYLYVKECVDSGLKYLGHTTAADPHAYKGSGTYWKRHIRAHGGVYTTTILGEYSTRASLQEAALHYSELWRVASSPEWANLCEENGVSSGNVGFKNFTFEMCGARGKKGGAVGGRIVGERSYIEKTHLFALSKEELRGHASVGGKRAALLKRGVHSPEARAASRERARSNNPFKGKRHSEESLAKMRAALADVIWVTDGANNRRIHHSELLAYEKQGYRRGRVMDWKRNQKRRAP